MQLFASVSDYPNPNIVLAHPSHEFHTGSIHVEIQGSCRKLRWAFQLPAMHHNRGKVSMKQLASLPFLTEKKTQSWAQSDGWLQVYLRAMWLVNVLHYAPCMALNTPYWIICRVWLMLAVLEPVALYACRLMWWINKYPNKHMWPLDCSCVIT